MGEAKDIKELEPIGYRMGKAWKEYEKHFHQFTKDFLEAKAAIESGRYGPDVNFDKWLVAHAGGWPFGAQMITNMIAEHCCAEAEQIRRWLVVTNRAIRRLYDEGVTRAEIARRLFVDRSHVSEVLGTSRLRPKTPTKTPPRRVTL